MKNKIITFICGFISALILSFAFVPALASGLQDIEVALNSVNITLNGTKITNINEGYVREGTEGEIPQSINYQGTIYLPLRRISEILNVNVDYDNNTKTIYLSTNTYTIDDDVTQIINNNTNTNKNTNENDIVPTVIKNYSDFKRMWTIMYETYRNDNKRINLALYRGSQRKNEFIEIWNNISMEDKIEYSKQLVQEKQQLLFPNKDLEIIFACSWCDLGIASCTKNQEVTSDFYENPF
jgi:hypothetical protein